ncbi:hypothetical protein LOAG_08553 [Loa loa]|uniref:Uncharacterized protein n=1 Tax=Loa loa TaxID=7209 RepID=A0A1S0TTD3_LOALO|nr:hypothetical protein LOAG_08553 [Loa loa]EFO19935.1 hypothetical protein LOAG_08553 [Loa loa]
MRLRKSNSNPQATDLWFGFTASFIFITMLEALIVISLEYKSRELRKKAEADVSDMSRYQIMMLMLQSSRYHSTARHIDRYWSNVISGRFPSLLHNLLFRHHRGR